MKRNAVISMILILCLLLCACGSSPEDMGTLDFEGMEAVEYEDADLEQQSVQHLTLPGTKYSQWCLDGEGRMVGCDQLKGLIVTVAE